MITGITTESRDGALAKKATLALDLALKINEDLTQRQNNAGARYNQRDPGLPIL
ncbi:hypothetical protein [Desulfoluna sp.]|uniref:hypothetical protein n=1 Tax=Desulfoluna sp. TaxID=2045199 RepID=UPI002625F359|nr:hypothetical protein [Desulfoluna sp.]